MGWDVAIWGTLTMDASAQEAWRQTVVTGRGWRDWKGWFKRASPGAPRSVQVALAAWARRSARGDELLEVKAGKRGVEVVGYLSQGAFIEEARDVAALFRCAEAAGATGRITFAGVGLSEAYRLELTAAGSTLTAVDEDLEGSPEVRRLARIAVARAEAAQAAKAARSAARKPAAPGGDVVELPAEARAALDEVHARLARADGAAVGAAGVAAATEVDARLHDDQQAAMAILARLDPAGAEPLLCRLASPGVPLALRVAAVSALAGARSDATVAVLLAAFDEVAGTVHKRFVGYDSPLRRAAAEALAATGRDDVFAAVLGRLTEEACAIEAGPTGAHIAPEARCYEQHDLVEGALYVLGRARYRPAWDRLAAIVRTSPLASLRVLAVGALVRMAEPSEIEGAFGEPAAAFHARAFACGAFNVFNPEAVGKKLLAYVKRQRRPS